MEVMIPNIRIESMLERKFLECLFAIKNKFNFEKFIIKLQKILRI